MALEEKFNNFHAHIQGMLEALNDLHTTIVEYRPLPHDSSNQDTPALVDILGTSVEDLIGWMMEALASSQKSQTAAHKGDIDSLWRSLTTSHQSISRVNQGLVADLMVYERVADIARVGRTRGGEWRAWAVSVKQTLDRCHQPLFELQQAQFECWQELIEHNGQPTISVQTMGINTVRSTPPMATSPHRGEL